MKNLSKDFLHWKDGRRPSTTTHITPLLFYAPSCHSSMSPGLPSRPEPPLEFHHPRLLALWFGKPCSSLQQQPQPLLLLSRTKQINRKPTCKHAPCKRAACLFSLFSRPCKGTTFSDAHHNEHPSCAINAAHAVCATTAHAWSTQLQLVDTCLLCRTCVILGWQLLPVPDAYC